MAFKDFFYFTKEERRGTMVLILIVCTLIGVRVSIAAIQSRGDSGGVPEDVKSVNAGHGGGSSGYRQYVKKDMGKIELNRADTIELQALRGIGPGFARRIFKYREKLGGYYAKEQLLEVYGFTEQMYEKVKDDVTVDASRIVPMNVNELDISQLKRHPYISFYEAKAIYEYRMSQPDGRIKEIGELKELPDLKDNWDIIKLYIKAE